MLRGAAHVVVFSFYTLPSIGTGGTIWLQRSSSTVCDTCLPSFIARTEHVTVSILYPKDNNDSRSQDLMIQRMSVNAKFPSRHDVDDMLQTKLPASIYN